jgi:ABC-type amino acid transport substrate-binding protein
MKRLLYFLLIYSLLFTILQADTKINTLQLTSDEKQYIKNNTVIVGIANWTPINFTKDGKTFEGIASDILHNISKSTGLKFKIEYGTWDDFIQKIKNKEIDLLPGTYHTNERESFGDFSKGYLKIKN